MPIARYNIKKSNSFVLLLIVSDNDCKPTENLVILNNNKTRSILNILRIIEGMSCGKTYKIR